MVGPYSPPTARILASDIVDGGWIECALLEVLTGDMDQKTFFAQLEITAECADNARHGYDTIREERGLML